MRNYKTELSKRSASIYRTLVFLMLGAVCQSCATSITVSSSPPGVDVFDGDKKIGTTPLEVSADKLSQEVADGRLIRFERQGYRKVWFWFPNGIRNMTVTVNLQPFFIVQDEQTKARNFSRAEMDAISSQILDLQSDLLLADQVDPAKTTKVISQSGSIGASQYLLALTEMRQGNNDKAKVALRQAILMSPSEPDYVILYRDLGGDPLKVLTPKAATPQPATELEEEK